jgi:hypothetical protein
MNTYGDALMQAKRESNSKAVKIVSLGFENTPGMAENAS